MLRRASIALAIALTCSAGAASAASGATTMAEAAAASNASTASHADASTAAEAAAHASAASAAASNDPLQAPECQQALAALHDEEAAAVSGASAPSAARGGRHDAHLPPGLEAARRHAAHSCLASRADSPPSSRLAQPPVVVPPVAGIRPPLAALPPAPAAVAIPTKPPSPPPLTSITACDASGCWASDGTRLNRVGPTLWGPHGACSVFGAVVHCP
jgi:hypothetical protein